MSFVDEILNLVEDLLKGSAVRALSLEFLNKMNMMYLRMLSWCLEGEEEIRVDICRHFKELIPKVLDTIVRYRMIKVLEGLDKVESVEKMYMSFIERLKELVLNSMWLGDKVLCRVVKPFYYRNGIVPQDYVVLMSLEQALLLAIAGFVEPLMIV